MAQVLAVYTCGSREKKAWTILAMMIGAVSVAQALPLAKSQSKILEAALGQLDFQYLPRSNFKSRWSASCYSLHRLWRFQSRTI